MVESDPTRSRTGVAGAAAATGTIAVALSLVATTGAVALERPDFPTWQDVQAAKHSEAAKRAEIAKIQKIITQLEAQAVALGKVAQQRGEQYVQAQELLNEATATADHIRQQAEDAQKQADDSTKRAQQLIVQLARTGGGDLTLGLMFGSGSDTDELLSRLGSMSQLTESSSQIVTRATFDRNAAKTLSEQASVAEAKRGSLASEAKKALAAANVAVAASKKNVEQTTGQKSTLYSQLATLTDKSAATEKAYYEGVAWEAAQNAIKDPPSAPVIDPNPPAPVGSLVTGAIAFAKAQLGEPYVLGGMGPNVWDCSGLTKAAYASVGIYIGIHGSTSQYSYLASQGKLVNISQLKAGDLLFYADGGSTSGTKYHTTLYIGGGKMIEAPYPGTTVRIAAIRYGDLVPYAARPRADPPPTHTLVPDLPLDPRQNAGSRPWRGGPGVAGRLRAGPPRQGLDSVASQLCGTYALIPAWMMASAEAASAQPSVFTHLPGSRSL